MSDSDADDALRRRLQEALGHDPTASPPPRRLEQLRAAANRAAPGSSDRPPAATGGLTSRRNLLGLGAAAASGAIVGIGIREALRDEPPEPPYQAITFQEAGAGVRVLSSRIIDHTWGMELVLDAEGFEPDAPYVVAFLSEGTEVEAGGFLGITGTVACRCNAPVRRAATAVIEVRAADGTTVLRSRLD